MGTSVLTLAEFSGRCRLTVVSKRLVTRKLLSSEEKRVIRKYKKELIDILMKIQKVELIKREMKGKTLTPVDGNRVLLNGGEIKYIINWEAEGYRLESKSSTDVATCEHFRLNDCHVSVHCVAKESWSKLPPDRLEAITLTLVVVDWLKYRIYTVDTGLQDRLYIIRMIKVLLRSFHSINEFLEHELVAERYRTLYGLS